MLVLPFLLTRRRFEHEHISYNLILTIYRHIPCNNKITRHNCGPFSMLSILSHTFEPTQMCFLCESTRILGFIMSINKIRLDPLKVEVILNLPPSTLRQLQSLQWKVLAPILASRVFLSDCRPLV
jgi:hypothetical protein